jgi:aromatic-L-amino-acid/L-tryptophan decarboxylase
MTHHVQPPTPRPPDCTPAVDQKVFDPEVYRCIGHQLIDSLADHIAKLSSLKMNTGISENDVLQLLGRKNCPDNGQDISTVFSDVTRLMCDHTVSTSHPKFLGYVMGSSAPFAALADLISSTLNPPVTSFTTSPLATGLESQTIKWMSQLINYPSSAGGLFLSGGSAANFSALYTALCKRTDIDVKRNGVTSDPGALLRIYCSEDAHSSIISAAQMCGLGTKGVIAVPVDKQGRLNITSLKELVEQDFEKGLKPFFIIGTAGTTSVGAIDPLIEIGSYCREHELWFHVDGAYGGISAISDNVPQDLAGMKYADSIAIDPHKWMYMPADVGCLLVREPDALFNAFYQGTGYYAKDGAPGPLGGDIHHCFRNLGPQVTRSLRALKVRVALQTLGRDGYRQLIDHNIHLARTLYQSACNHPKLEALSCNLSITIFRFNAWQSDGYCVSGDEINAVNRDILNRLHSQSIAFPSHLEKDGTFWIRVCVVNHVSTENDLNDLLEAIVNIGQVVEI